MTGALAQQWSRLLGDVDAALSDAGVSVVAWHVRGADSDWVGRVWTAAQARAGLPAPAIAVDGASGWLLCFALAARTPADDAVAVLRALIRDLLREGGVAVSDADVSAWRFSCWPQAPGGRGEVAASDWPVPRQTGADRWSAFVAADLVPLFAETPWLDCAPGDEGQAALLSRLQPITTADWTRLQQFCQPAAQPETAVTSGLRHQTGPAVADDPRAFLRSVMNDTSVDLALRIEAARALLAHG